MITAHFHIFEYQQLIQDSPHDQSLQHELETHLIECNQCRQYMALIQTLQKTAPIGKSIPHESKLSDIQMIDMIKRRAQQKKSVMKILAPFPGLAWVTTIILIVVLLSWAVDRLLARQNITSINTLPESTPVPTRIATAIKKGAPDCRKILYTVDEGDTILAISAFFNVDALTIVKENGLDNNSVLKPGMKILIPFCGWNPDYRPSDLEQYGVTPLKDCPYVHYTVQPGDTLNAISATFKISVSSLVSLNQINNTSVLSPQKDLAIVLCRTP